MNLVLIVSLAVVRRLVIVATESFAQVVSVGENHY